MKKFFLVIISFFCFITLSYGDNSNVYEVNREIIFKYISKDVLTDIPNSYKYINLNFIDIDKKSQNYEYVQKLVYADLIQNNNIKLNLNLKLNSYLFYKILEKESGYNFINSSNINVLKSRNTTNFDLFVASSIIPTFKKDKENLLKIFGGDQQKMEIFQDVNKTILNDYYDSSKINQNDLIYSSIEGLAQGSKDKFTSFFPPSENKDFQETLSGEFEGIGSYVDMEKPGELKIISPIAGSPSEKAGLKGGDKIIKINGIEITKDTTLSDSVSMIKGPAGTKVVLDILRGNEKLQIEIIRQKIIINDVEYKIINNDFFYIQMKIFGDKIFSQTSKAIDELNNHKEIKKVIIDLRNNPGGYLDQAVNLLSLFIGKNNPVCYVKYKSSDYFYNSYGYNKIDLNNYEVYILVNSGTASASEILTGTLKDYFPNIKIIGEKTYGKGSVQTIKSYTDGSSLKYTIAKWFTGKTKTGIDGIGIYPDIDLPLDVEKFKTGEDNQLNYILNGLK
ncbi:MAG: S41 family peptidase [Candidatus Gracilibacteria bacterium]|nr:S41 family peptidase [Candidatus Gracilibacteria bacterium]